MLPLVESLFGRVKVLLLSNTNVHPHRLVRPLLPLLERFDSLVLSYELGLAKPDPAIFAEALRRAGTAAARTAFFDDVEAYVEAARALGIRDTCSPTRPASASSWPRWACSTEAPIRVGASFRRRRRRAG